MAVSATQQYGYIIAIPVYFYNVGLSTGKGTQTMPSEYQNHYIRHLTRAMYSYICTFILQSLYYVQ